ncbi:hypothetical protein [Saccharophagus degradans]|uniref:Solute-binding protein family 3/N-terminal domain-containing protein n=1 Tax=Saccharophagus degradans TaxID=86304 RepID=A0AAW7X9T5_9GAMM|nr:hypothetical protein [Saccharophagus degradans]MDO6424010.1 hypothetical protein [Saccharophagus degradans]MDO6609151.1 hypothetical protein [Saccharophagus degradans]
MRIWRKLHLLFGVSVCLLTLAVSGVQGSATQEVDVMQIRYWNGTAARDSYELALLLLALDKTAADYPPFNITRLEADLGSDRARHELARGELINIYAAPYRARVGEVETQIVQVPNPLLKGLLGYRNLIIREKDLARFEQISNKEELKPILIGQGRSWPDVAIYRHNGLQVMDEGLFSNLFAMLSLGRFDCLPLGVVEAKATLAAFDGDKLDLTIAPDLLLYYPWPVLFQISGKHPLLAERVTKGLALAAKDGSFDALFDHYYGELVEQLREQESKMIVLENPTLKEKMGLQEPQLTALGL